MTDSTTLRVETNDGPTWPRVCRPELVDEHGPVVALQSWYSGPTRAVTDTGERVMVNATVRYQWSFRTMDETTTSNWTVSDEGRVGEHPETASLTHGGAGTAISCVTATHAEKPIRRSAAFH